MSNPGSARERLATLRAGAALAPCMRPAGRGPSDWARFEPTCNVLGDDGQHHSDTKSRHSEVRTAQRFVMAGPVPAIPIMLARRCLPKQDARPKAGHDASASFQGAVCRVG
jgi:hypothetical protein